MEIIHGINNIRKIKKVVLAMGVFDGLHRGHKDILRAVVKKAREIKGTSVVLTFWPHPQKQGSLYSLEHRLRLISEIGIDLCIVINFSRRFAGIKAEDFIKHIIAGKINAKYVYVGNDFKFGRDTEGGISLLKKLGKVYDFKVKGFKIVKLLKSPISSTLIRSLIKKGEIKRAGELLDRPVSILGTVIKGTALGRILGFPTANINPHHEVIPARGIYAVKVILGDRKMKGACYIGSRPTIIGHTKKINIEVYIFNFKSNIYGKYLEIQFIEMIRKDEKFPSLVLLAHQIKKDISLAKKILS
jgi:riboflavin kinase/FMN adenylyltransferase